MRVSVVSCVSDWQQYEANVRASLSGVDAQLVPIDSVGNPWSAPQALNQGWQRAEREIVVFCHQDVVFPYGWLGTLDEQLRRIADADGRWGVAGTYGRLGKAYYGHVEDPRGRRRDGERLPHRVETLDEHCLVVRRELPFRFDESLGGFHFYGVDLCLTARAFGLWNYALDCRVTHLSAGNKSEAYYELRRAFERKWRRERWRRLAWQRIPAKMHGPTGPLHFGLHHALRR